MELLHPEFAASDSDFRDRVDLELLRSFCEDGTYAESDLVVELIDLYQAETESSLDRLSKAVASHDWSSVKRVAHSLRGSSSNLGINIAAEISRQLETDVLEEALADRLLSRLRSELRIALQILADEKRRRLT